MNKLKTAQANNDQLTGRVELCSLNDIFGVDFSEVKTTFDELMKRPVTLADVKDYASQAGFYKGVLEGLLFNHDVETIHKKIRGALSNFAQHTAQKSAQKSAQSKSQIRRLKIQRRAKRIQ